MIDPLDLVAAEVQRLRLDLERVVGEHGLLERRCATLEAQAADVQGRLAAREASAMTVHDERVEIPLPKAPPYRGAFKPVALPPPRVGPPPVAKPDRRRRPAPATVKRALGQRLGEEMTG